MASFAIENLSFTYPGGSRPALQGVTLQLEEGEFVLLCGKSGCGKSTLLRHLKTVLTPHGVRSGSIRFAGTLLDEVGQREQASRIGFVLQNPDNQIVTDKVWHELAFGLESLGFDNATIRLRVAEMASFFGIQTWFHRNVTELSGGQKQLLNLASVMAMQPDVLVLDEPTSQLDPIAASEFLETVSKINRELGTTVLLSEHRLEEVFPLADRVVVMDEGRVLVDAPPRAAGEQLYRIGHDMFSATPTAMRIHAEAAGEGPLPLTVREGRRWLDSLYVAHKPKIVSLAHDIPSEEQNNEAISLKDVWFRYEKDAPDVVKDCSFTVYEKELFCIVGGNGTGKTTTLSLVSGIQRPYRGKVRLFGRDIQKYSDQELFHNCLGVLPQNPQSLFVKKTVELDLLEMFSGSKRDLEIYREEILKVAQLVEIEDLLQAHPYDLSGGEQQRAALAKVLLLKPRLMLLDEPTKGLDSHFKQKLAGILKRLRDEGVTVLMVSHDIEFCAQWADRCALFFDGSIVSQGRPREFFSGNSFYTTAANRMSRHLFQNAVTNEDVITLCAKNQ
jgi:energy-coupling factor transporter ATP-binding protein EcfA2